MFGRPEHALKRFHTAGEVEEADGAAGFGARTPASDVVAHPSDFANGGVHRGVSVARAPQRDQLIGAGRQDTALGPMVARPMQRGKHAPLELSSPINGVAAKLRSVGCTIVAHGGKMRGVYVHDGGVLHFAAEEKARGTRPFPAEVLVDVGPGTVAVRRVRGCSLVMRSLLRRVRGDATDARHDFDLDWDEEEDHAEGIRDTTEQAFALLSAPCLESHRAGMAMLLWLACPSRGFTVWSEATARAAAMHCGSAMKGSGDIDLHLMSWTVLGKMVHQGELPSLRSHARTVCAGSLNVPGSLKGVTSAAKMALRQAVERAVAPSGCQ